MIKYISKKIKDKYIDLDNIEELFLEREKLGMTEISEYVAIPHPIKSISNVNLISVCLLKNKIKWIENEVNVVLFMLINNSNGENENIYKLLTKVINDKNIIDNMLKKPSYEEYINILKELEEKQ